MSKDNLIDLTALLHERRILRLQKEMQNLTEEDLGERISKLVHSEEAYQRMLEDIAKEKGESSPDKDVTSYD